MLIIEILSLPHYYYTRLMASFTGQQLSKLIPERKISHDLNEARDDGFWKAVASAGP